MPELSGLPLPTCLASRERFVPVRGLAVFLAATSKSQLIVPSPRGEGQGGGTADAADIGSHLVATSATTQGKFSMRVMIVGGAGFVGLNIAARLAADGHDVVALDRAPPPAHVRAAIGGHIERIRFIAGDVTRPETINSAIGSGIDWVIYGAAITADAARDAAEPEHILAVNLAGLVPVVRAARDAGARRVINLSSAVVYGPTGDDTRALDETRPANPVSLYAITKFASERVADRLADLWDLDIVSVRLSAVFGPFEQATGVRDTLSAPGQIMIAAARGQPAILSRPGIRDWLYAPDAADAVALLLAAPKLAHRLYNVTAPAAWPALAFGEALARRRPGFVCRLAAPGEQATIDLHGSTDRAALSPARLRDEFGWTARHDLAGALDDFDAWARLSGTSFWSTP